MSSGSSALQPLWRALLDEADHRHSTLTAWESAPRNTYRVRQCFESRDGPFRILRVLTSGDDAQRAVRLPRRCVLGIARWLLRTLQRLFYSEVTSFCAEVCHKSLHSPWGRHMPLLPYPSALRLAVSTDRDVVECVRS